MSHQSAHGSHPRTGPYSRTEVLGSRLLISRNGADPYVLFSATQTLSLSWWQSTVFVSQMLFVLTFFGRGGMGILARLIPLSVVPRLRVLPYLLSPILVFSQLTLTYGPRCSYLHISLVGSVPLLSAARPRIFSSSPFTYFVALGSPPTICSSCTLYCSLYSLCAS